MDKEIDFSDITKNDILDAFVKYDEMKENNKLNNSRRERSYLLFWNGKEYPHKYIVGIAYGLKNNHDVLDNSLYNSMGNHKSSAQWCVERNGFVLYADKKYKDYLQKKFENQTTINTYYSDLKKAIKIYQNIDKLKTKNLNEIFEIMEKGDVTFEEYDKSQKELGYNDKQLSTTLKTKARTYLEAINSTNNFETEEKQKEECMPNLTKQPLNQILYGPPGTGKTYNTINKALGIIDGVVPEKREDAKKKFEEYLKAGQIEFVTFHQSYGYEEFVEGIKADLKSEDVKYKLEKGIFQRISIRAKENYVDSQKSTEALKEEKSIKQKITQFLNDSLESQSEFTKTKGGKFKIKDLSETVISIYTEDSNYNENVIELDIEEFTKIISSDIEIKTSRQLAKDIFGINNQRQKDTYYFAMWKQFKEIKFSLEEEIINEELKNYILIIDEINRGNISKIFGELITLIEPSKRIGADEEITLKLPYSNPAFGVPQNLYIIGTMNTADRSIALMDTALRRRFDFTEMMPDLETLNELEYIEGINIKSLLETINKRIEYLYDRDHTIGHAYFMSLKDKNGDEVKAELDNIFRNKIIPLLQEYFYDDWEKIQIVLGDHPEQFKKKEISKNFNQYQFIQSEKIKEEEVLGLDHPDIENNGVEYKINSIFKHEAYLKIYGEYPKLKTDENEEQTNTFN